MQITSMILLTCLMVCAIGALLSKNLFHTVLIFTGFGTVLSILWLVLQAPDLAITEAAVGVGVTAVLYFLTLKRLNRLKGEDNKDVGEA